MAWLAYMDESMRQLPDRAGIYVLATAVLESTRLHAQRDAVKQIRGGRAFHWRLGDPADKRKAVSVVADIEAIHLVTAGVRLDSRRQERAGVERVLLDSRTASLNRRDIALVDRLRIRGLIGPQLAVDFHSTDVMESRCCGCLT